MSPVTCPPNRGKTTSFVPFSNNANTYSGTITINENTTSSEGGVYLGVNGSTALSNATLATTTIPGSNLKFGTSPIVFKTGLGSATIGAIGGSAPLVLTGYDQSNHTYGADSIALTVGGNNASTTLSGVISGGGSVTKSGSGTMTLSGANTYTGNTTVSNGTLKLSGSGSISNSPTITIASGATFDVSSITYTLGASQTIKGNGSVNGNFAAASGSASIQPGTSAGTLTFNNNLSLSNGASLTFELSTSASTGNDKIVVGGNLSLSSTNTIHISALSGAANLDTTADYVLFAVSGTTTISSAPSLVWDGTAPANYQKFSITTNGNNVVLHFSDVPTLSAVVNPTTLTRNQSFTVTALGTNGSGNIVSVQADLSQLGGSASATLVLSNNNVYTNTFTVGASASTGTKSVTVTATDDTTPTALVGSNTVTSISVIATNQTWNGAASDNDLTSNLNWLSGWAPGFVGDALMFAGTTRLSPNVNTNYTLTGLTFDNTAGAFTLASSSGNSLTLAGGVTNNSTSGETINVPLTLSGAQTINAAAGDITVSGALTNGGSLATFAGSSNSTVSGVISGSGGLAKLDTGSLTLAGANTYSGSTTLRGGTTTVSGSHSGGSYVVGSASGDNAVLSINTSGTIAPPTFGAGTPTFTVGNSSGSTGTVTMTSGKLGTGGEIWMSAATGAKGVFNLNGGTVLVSNWTAIGRGGNNGVLNINGGSWTNTGANNFVLASFANNVGFATVTSGTLATDTGNQMWIGEAGLGVLNINGGTVAAGRTANPALVVGRAGGGAGSIRLSSGRLDSADQMYLGHGTGSTGSYGELNQSGGTGISRYYLIVGLNSDRAIFRQSGGAFWITNKYMTIGAGGTASIGGADLSGGTFTSLDASDGGIYAGENGVGILNVRGTAAVTLPASATLSGLRIGGGTGSTGVVNLASGTISTPRVARGNVGLATLNFNGGTLQAATNNTGFITNLDSVMVYGGGATIHDGGFGITVPLALRAPTGSGVTSIAVSSGGSNYIGAPLVQITGGTLTANGRTATAIANMTDDGSGNGTLSVSSITVICPGDYSDTTGLTATLLSGGQNFTAATLGSIATAANASGGLTKAGNGTLTLSGANTYMGNTAVNAGTLLVNGSLASGGSVSSGATLGGNGSISGAVSIDGTLTPGTSIGTLTFGTAPTLGSGSALVAELNQTNAQTADKIVVSSGTLNFGGTLTITNIGPMPTNGTFTLFAGAVSGSFAATNLPTGGVAHWKTDMLNVDGTVRFTNSNPVVSALTMGTRSGVAVSVKVIGGKHPPSDAENDSLTVASVTTPANGSASTDGVNITYTPSNTFTGTDSFNYTVSDGFGGTATATVTVTVTANGEGSNRLSATTLGGGTNVLTFLGIPGTNYCLELATNLAAPVSWYPQQTNTAPANGLLIYTNVSTWPETYYRTKYVP